MKYLKVCGLRVCEKLLFFFKKMKLYSEKLNLKNQVLFQNVKVFILDILFSFNTELFIVTPL